MEGRKGRRHDVVKSRMRTKSRRRGSSPRRVFVGNISYRVTEAQLEEFFASAFGRVLSAEIIKDHKKGWSRGIGFVTFASVESAELALKAFPEQLILDERALRISVPTIPKRHQNIGEMVDGLRCCHLEVAQKESGFHVEDKSEDPVHDDSTVFLNDDILFLVFSFLPLKERIRAERVCKQWVKVARKWWKSAQFLSFDGVFISFKGRYAALTDSILSSVLSRGCRELRSLNVSACPNQLTDYSLHLIGMYCSKLTSLNISHVSVTPRSLKMLTQKCSALKVLIIRGCHSVGEKSLWWALHHCRELEELDVSQNRRITGQFFYMSVPKLSIVSLCNSDSMTDEGISLLAKKSPNLHCLDVSCCTRLTGASLRALIEHCVELQKLHFCGPNKGVLSSDFKSVIALPNMEELVVDQQICFNDDVLSGIPNFSKLRKLSCAACYTVSNRGLQSLSKCTGLRDLNISYCHLVGDDGIETITKVGLLLKLIARGCLNITDKGLVEMSKYCTTLVELDVSGCWQVTNKSLYALQENLLHMRSEQQLSFSLTLGGTDIDGELAVQFAKATGSSVSMHDLSIPSLLADYDPLFSFHCEEEVLGEHNDLSSSCDYEPGNYLMDKAYDWLEADDPALFSDEFSEPEEWGL